MYCDIGRAERARNIAYARQCCVFTKASVLVVVRGNTSGIRSVSLIYIIIGFVFKLKVKLICRRCAVRLFVCVGDSVVETIIAFLSLPRFIPFAVSSDTVRYDTETTTFAAVQRF